MYKKYIISTLILGIILSICDFLTACSKSTTNTIAPSVNIPGKHNWKRKDISFCRLYYYQDEDYVLESGEELNTIYKQVCEKFKHYSQGNPEENGKVTFIFLDDNTYKEYTKDTVSGAGWSGKVGFINLSKKSSNTIYSTFRHELIHAVTLSSIDTKVKNCPGDGLKKVLHNIISRI